MSYPLNDESNKATVTQKLCFFKCYNLCYIAAMAYLAIDYGKKFIGLATSDESGILAFPLSVIPNNDNVISHIDTVCKDKQIVSIVIGDSVDQAGQKNSIARYAEEFAEMLKEKLNLPIFFQKEQFTSAHAREGAKAGQRIDASAAALILQRFLDKNNRK